MEILTTVLIVAVLVFGVLIFIAYRAHSRNAEVLAESRAEQARLAEKVKHAEEQLIKYNELEKRFSDAFKALSSDVLKAQGESFHLTAEQSLRSREEAVDKLVKPLSVQIDTLEILLAAREGALSQQIETLKHASDEVSSEAKKLSSALTQGPQVRGSWGEMQVERALELSGLTKGMGYTVQDSDEQGGRTDFIVRLPNERHIIIDSKVSINAYLEAANAVDDEERTKHLENHARSVKGHVDNLSKKEYWQNLPSTPDFVVMAIPDYALLPALQHAPNLIDYALQKQVVLATFSTLVALLRCVEMGWQERTSIDKVREIIECGKELHDRLRIFSEHFEGIGNDLEKTVRKYNESVGSFDSRLITQAQRFTELGVRIARELPNPQTIEPSVRPLRNRLSNTDDEEE